MAAVGIKPDVTVALARLDITLEPAGAMLDLADGLAYLNRGAQGPEERDGARW